MSVEEARCLSVLHFLAGFSWAFQRPQGFVMLLFEDAGLSQIHSGLLSMTGLVAPIIGGPILALSSDRLPRTQKHRIYITAVLLKACLYLVVWPCLFLLAGEPRFWASIVAVASATFWSIGGLLAEWTVRFVGRDGFGRVRLWGGVGFAVGSLLTGVSVKLLPALGTRALFLGSSAAAALTAAGAAWMGSLERRRAEAAAASDSSQQLSEPQPDVQESRGQTLGRLLGSWHTLMFLLTLLALGIGEGVMQEYTYIRLQLLPHGGSIVMGISALCMIISEIPFFFYAHTLTKRFGVFPISTMALVCMFLRQTWTAQLRDAWWILPVEFLHGITYSVANAAYVLYSADISPLGLENTVQSLTYAVFTGLGQGGAAILGGLVRRRSGVVALFRASALLTLLAALLPACLWLNSRRQRGALETPLELPTLPPS